MQQVFQNKSNLALKISGLAVFIFGLIFALPALAATTTSLPAGIGKYHDWTAVGDSSSTVTVQTNDGDTTYISETSDNSAETFVIANASIPSGAVVNSVTLNAVARSSKGSPSINLRLEKGDGNDNKSDDSAHNLTSSTTYVTYSRILTKNPFTNAAWTRSEVNSWPVKFGVNYNDHGSNNTARVTQIYVVVNYTLTDTTSPIISSHDAVIVEATASNTPVTYTLPTATDNIDGTLPVTCSPASDTLFAVGTTPVVCTATDSSGNSASTTFNVVVNDTTAPIIDSPVHTFVEATGPDGAVATYAVPNAVDAVDGTFPATCAPASGILYPLGVSEVTCTATDTAGNAANPVQVNINVLDTTAPVITLNGSIIVDLNVGGTYVESGATATDIVDGDVTTTNNIVITGFVNTSTPGTYIIHYNVTDSHGNAANQVIRVVYVSDVTAPVINPISDITAEAASSAGVVVEYGDVTATDDVDGIVTTTCDHVSGSVFPIGITNVSCTAVDSSGNVGAGLALTVTVQDTTAPEITITAPTTVVEATSSAGAEVDYTAIATDAVDGTLVVDCSPATGTMFPMGETTITCTAADAHGNRATSTAAVLVKDMEAPDLTLPPDQTFEATGFLTAPVGLVLATTTDNIDPTPVLTYTPNVFPLGNTEVSWKSTDASDNIAIGSSHVRIIDTTAPVITLNGDANITLSVGDIYTEQGAVVTDNHDTELTVIIGGDVVNTAVAGTYHVTYDAADSSGNHAVQQIRTVVVSTPASSGGVSGGGGTFVAPTPPSFGDHPITVGGGLGSTSTIILTFDVQNASWIAISETPNFDGVSWVPYTTSTTFTLSASNTEHKLYIKFRRVNGGETKIQEVTVLLNTPSTLIQAVLGVKITRLNVLANKLKYGNRGAEVSELQTLLKQAGFFPAKQTVTGYYGPITRAAVKKYLATIK